MGKAGLVAGVDCSTQSTKVLVVDPDTGDVVVSGRASHEVSGTGGARETDPRVWWEALGQAMAETGMAADITALSIAGQQHGLVVLDASDGPLRPAMLWNDVRSAPQASRLTERWGAEDWAERIGVVPVASFTISKWQWLVENEPQTAAAARRVLLPHDYLTLRLTGNASTDRGDASGTGWWSTASEEYSDEALDLVGLDPALLPDIVAPGDRAGVVSGEASEATGVPAGTPVAGGTGDNMGAALGLGLRPGRPVVSLGTSGTIYAVSESRIVDPTGVVAGFATADRGFLPLAATLNCTLAVDRFAAWLGLDREEVADATDVVVLPYLDGERTPNLPEAAGSIHGLRHATRPEEILLAAYQGAAASLLEAMTAISTVGSGIPQDAPLTLIGGGARGAAWQRVIADLSQRVLMVPETDEPVAMGAAIQAASMITGSPGSDIAESWSTMQGPLVEPGEERGDILERIKATRAAAC
ncbi:MAG TPA: xylulokinase [Acidimicrobiia bacterium]|nr:xylulokinase [Acidimicrobiia bacterium]